MIGGIKSDRHVMTTSAFKPIEVKFYPNAQIYSDRHEMLCVSASDVMEAINEIDPLNSRICTYRGLTSQMSVDGKLYLGIEGVVSMQNAGKFARVSENGDYIEWVDIEQA